MATNVATLVARLEADVKDFQRRMDGVEKSVKATEGRFQKFGDVGAMAMKAAVGVAAVKQLAGFGKAMLDLGVQVEAWGRRYDTVFGEASGIMDQFVRDNASRFGISEERFKGLAASVGDLLVPMGFARDTSAQLSQEILTTANALSEWSGGAYSAEDAAQRITKAILGEREGLVELGVKISEADLKQRLLEKGMGDLTGAALEQAKAQATLELITGKSADALTAYAEGGSGAMKAQKDLNAALDSLAVTVSEQLLPVLVPLVQTLANMLSALDLGAAEKRFNSQVNSIAENLLAGATTADAFGEALAGSKQMSRIQQFQDAGIDISLLEIVARLKDGGEAWDRFSDEMARAAVEAGAPVELMLDLLGDMEKRFEEGTTETDRMAGALLDAGIAADQLAITASRETGPAIRGVTADSDAAVGSLSALARIRFSGQPMRDLADGLDDFLLSLNDLDVDAFADLPSDIADAWAGINLDDLDAIVFGGGLIDTQPLIDKVDAMAKRVGDAFATDMPDRIEAAKEKLNLTIEGIIDNKRLEEDFRDDMKAITDAGLDAVADALLEYDPATAAALAADIADDISKGYIAELSFRGATSAALQKVADLMAADSGIVATIGTLIKRLGGDWTKDFAESLALRGATAEQVGRISALLEDSNTVNQALALFQTLGADATVALAQGLTLRGATADDLNAIRNLIETGQSPKKLYEAFTGMGESATASWKTALRLTGATAEDIAALSAWFSTEASQLKAIENAFKMLGGKWGKLTADQWMALFRETVTTFGIRNVLVDRGMPIHIANAILGLQHGGRARMGVPYIVGEAGPELFVPTQSGTVVSNPETMSMISGRSGGSTVNIVVEGSVIMQNELEGVVAKALRAAHRGGTAI